VCACCTPLAAQFRGLREAMQEVDPAEGAEEGKEEEEEEEEVDEEYAGSLGAGKWRHLRLYCCAPTPEGTLTHNCELAHTRTDSPGCVHVSERTHTDIHTHVHTRTQTYIHMYTHVHKHTYTHIHTHTHTYIHAHTHTHTHTRMRALEWKVHAGREGAALHQAKSLRTRETQTGMHARVCKRTHMPLLAHAGAERVAIIQAESGEGFAPVILRPCDGADGLGVAVIATPQDLFAYCSVRACVLVALKLVCPLLVAGPV